MTERLGPTKAEILLGELYTSAFKGDMFAGSELSKIALGGSPFARKLVELLDSSISRATEGTRNQSDVKNNET